MVLEVMNSEDWRAEQFSDLNIALILRVKEKGKRPAHIEVVSKNISVRIYWDALVVKDDILYRRWEAPNLKKSVFQLIVP